jgi:hypothetical protein
MAIVQVAWFRSLGGWWCLLLSGSRLDKKVLLVEDDFTLSGHSFELALRRVLVHNVALVARAFAADERHRTGEAAAVDQEAARPDQAAASNDGGDDNADNSARTQRKRV